MALLSRLFPNRKSSKNSNLGWSQKDQKKIQTFGRDDLRLVIFRDHDLHGRSLMFDSQALQVCGTTNVNEPKRCLLRSSSKDQAKKCPFTKSQLGANTPVDPGGGKETREKGGGTVKNDDKYSFARSKSDSNVLGEMIFGSVAMSYQGSTLKVHSIRAPPQIMVTNVFLPTRNSRESTDSESFDSYSLQSSIESSVPKKIATSDLGNSSMAHSVPVDVPSPLKRELSVPEEDSGLSSSVTSTGSSLRTSLPSPSSSTSSLNSNSLNRRYMRNQLTSLEYSIKKRQSDEGIIEPIPASKRPPKIGIGIVFTLPGDDVEKSRTFQNFFFSHVTLIESHVNKLKMAIDRATQSSRTVFVPLVVEAMDSFRYSLSDLYNTPRLLEPVWLNMMCDTTRRMTLCHQFLKEFMFLVEKFDTKNTKFFVSTLVTAVLTHHLAWVPTVTPAGASPSRAYLDKHSAKWLDTLAKSHPYNPLWAQLSDMYGAIGFPLRLSRTVVVGRKTDIVRRILYVLSYFIRCSEVHENVELKCGSPSSSEPARDIPNFKKDMSPIRETLRSNMCDHVSLNDFEHAQSPASTADLTMTPVESCMLSSGSTIVSVEASQHSGIDAQLSPMLSAEHPIKCDTTECDTAMALYHSTEVQSNNGSDFVSSVNCDSGFQSMDVNELNRNICDASESGATHCRKFYIPQHLAEIDCITDTASEDLGCQENSTDIGRDAEVCYADCISSGNETAEQVLPDLKDALQSNLPSDCCATSSISDISSDKEADCGNTASTGSSEGVVKCRLSDVEVREVRVLNVRHVGKMAMEDSSVDFKNEDHMIQGKDSSDPQHMNRGSDVSLGDSAKNACPYSNPASPVSTGAGTTSPVENTKCTSPVSSLHEGEFGSPISPIVSPSCSSPIHSTVHSGSPAVGCMNGNASNITEKDSSRSSQLKQSFAINYLRSNSMFDEYFEEDCLEPILMSVDTNLARKESISTLTMDNYEMFDEYFTEGAEPLVLPDNIDQLCQNYKRYGFCESSRSDSTNSAEVLQTSAASEQQDGDNDDVPDQQPYLRQASSQSVGNPARCRSVTPTELGRRRHVSAVSITSNPDYENHDPFENLTEVPLPDSSVQEVGVTTQTFDRNFGRSLLAGYSDHYISDFVLHGTGDTNIQGKVHNDLTMTVQNSVLDEPIAEASCVVADTDKWCVRLNTCQYHASDRVRSVDITASQLVCNIIESVHALWKLKMSPEFCLMHMEDRLQEIFFKSKTLSEFYLRQQKKVSWNEAAQMLGFDESDHQLLLAVAGTHSPCFSLGLM